MADVRTRRRRTASLTATVLVTVVGVTVLAVLIGPALRSPNQVAADTAPPNPSLVTVAVERRSLAEPIVLRGRIQPGAAVSVLPPATAVGPDSVITNIPVRSGDRVDEGQVLAERAGTPMFALALPFALYRNLTPGSKGPDVKAVQQALQRIGYAVSVTGVFDAATQRQVAKLYRDRGYSAPTNLTASDSQQMDGGADGVGMERSAVLLIDRAGRRISRVELRVGDVLADPKKPMFALDGQEATITAIANADQASLLKVGQLVDVVDDLTNEDAEATVSQVGRKVVSTADGLTGFEVQMQFEGEPLDADADRSLRLDMRASAGAPVLAVPVTAIYSRPDGTTFVTVVSAHGSAEDVTVTPGRTAGGWVELRKPAAGVLKVGVAVVVGENITGG